MIVFLQNLIAVCFWNRPFAFYQLFHKPYLDFLAFYLSPWAFYSSIDYLSCNYIEDIFTPLEAEEFYRH